MKTIQMTIDEPLLQSVDQIVDQLGTNRSAFIRDALVQALRRARIQVLEQQQITGYQAQPQQLAEISQWDNEHVWGEP